MSCGDSECHVSLPAMVGALAAAIPGVWLIVEQRRHPGAMHAFALVVAAWAFLASFGRFGGAAPINYPGTV